MASTNNPDLTKTPKRRTTTTSRKLRLVAKIADVSGEASWISVTRPADGASESVKLSFKDQSSASRKEAFEFDCCFDRNEDNALIFSREVKPLIPGLLEGCNATVVALGARGSGKTSLIQGSSEKPGLAIQAVDEIISMAEENGCAITISSYEVCQDRIYDSLAFSRREVLVLGNGQGKIQLKGLSRVPVKSMTEFSKLYASRKKAPTKGPVELSRRCHKGLIVYVSSQKENSDSLPISKLNFIDLAGYEDTRRKSLDCVNQESSKINKSICALINVVSAVSSNGNHVPYRENKLTHLLQDSLGGTSKVLMITCLKPSFCQDSICMVRTVARSSQNTNQAVTDSTKKSNGLTTSVVRSSSKCHLSMTASAIAKKQTSSRLPLSEKKVNGPPCNKANGSVTAASKGKKLFNERSLSTKPMKASATSDTVSPVETCVPAKEYSSLNVTEGPEQLKSGNPSSDALHPMEPTSIVKKDVASLDYPKHGEHSLNEEKNCLILDDSKHAEDKLIVEKNVSVNFDDPPIEDNDLGESSSTRDALTLVEVDDMEKANKNFPDNEVASPPISTKLQELASKMKSLCSSNPLSKISEENDTASNNLAYTGTLEPKTPVTSQHNDIWDVTNVKSPWEALSVRSASVKQSLVQEYLSFLNTASKEDLKRLKGIGEKRATYILDCRVETPEPFKSLDDLQDIGLSGKLVKNMMKSAGGLFD